MTRRHFGMACSLWLLAAMLLSGSAEGTTEISGRVMSATSPPAPLARVFVTLAGKSLQPSRTVITDGEGRFVFANLSTGSFTVTASRPAFITTAFGAKRPGRPGTPITLTAGQRITNVTIALARGAVVTGIVRGIDGAPASGAEVTATASETASPLVAMTDDRGVYRIYGLVPGKYVVSAKVSGSPMTTLRQTSDEQMDALLARLQRRGVASSGATAPAPGNTSGPSSSAATRVATYGYAPIYFPGTADADEATTLTLVADEERTGIDIGIRLVRSVWVEGRVALATGTLPSDTQVVLTRQGLRAGGQPNSLASPAMLRQPDPTGAFRFPGVLPGKYKVMARASGVWALTDIAVADDDVSGLDLQLQPALRLTGRVTFDARTQTPPANLSAVRLRVTDLNNPTFVVNGAARPDGTFEVSGILPGTHAVGAPGVDGGWWLRSVAIGGRDVLDFPLEITSADVSGAVVTFTDRHTELAGSLQSAPNVPAPEYFVVVFPADRAFWRPGARRIQVTRPSTDGRFVFRDLPGGDYLIAALTDREASDLADVLFIQQLVPLAASVRIVDGEQTTRDLQVVRSSRS